MHGEPLPVRQRFVHSKEKVQVIENQINKWLNDKFIKVCLVPTKFNSSLVVVPKRDASGEFLDWRVCLDFRPLNECLEADYHEMPIKTCFTWKNIQYMFLRAPFGLKNLTCHFQRFMTVLFADMVHFLIIYVDDILVFSRNATEHVEHLYLVFKRLNKYHMTVNIEKSKIGYVKVRSLGHVVSAEGLEICPEKFEVLKDFPLPTNGTQIQAFTGLVNFFRDQVPLHSTIR